MSDNEDFTDRDIAEFEPGWYDISHEGDPVHVKCDTLNQLHAAVNGLEGFYCGDYQFDCSPGYAAMKYVQTCVQAEFSNVQEAQS